MASFYTLYGERPQARPLPMGVSKAKQEYRDECDIGFIMSRYEQTGMFYDGLKRHVPREPLFGDFSNVPILSDSIQLVHEADDNFKRLPAHVRTFFNNSVSVMHDFLSNPANTPIAQQLGLIARSEKAVVGGAGAPLVVSGTTNPSDPGPSSQIPPEGGKK